jgi:hypothetical protein
MKAESVDKIIQRIRIVPDQYRAFTEGAEEAARIHKIPEDLLPEMLDLGLPCRASESGYRFDRTDLENVALALHFRCPRYIAMQWWARSFDTIVADEQIEFSLRINAKCPLTGHPGPCDFSASSYLEGAVAPNSLAVSPDGVVTARVCLSTKAVVFSGAHSELFDRLAGLTLHIFPESMPVESWRAYETGLADCRIAARLLVQGATEFGLAARPASGFFMASPFPMRHVWVEFEIAGSWVTADPFLLQSLDRWAIVDGKHWPVYRSPPGLLWRLQSADSIGTPLVLHAGREAPSSCVIHRKLCKRAVRPDSSDVFRLWLPELIVQRHSQRSHILCINDDRWVELGAEVNLEHVHQLDRSRRIAADYEEVVRGLHWLAEDTLGSVKHQREYLVGDRVILAATHHLLLPGVGGDQGSRAFNREIAAVERLMESIPARHNLRTCGVQLTNGITRTLAGSTSVRCAISCQYLIIPGDEYSDARS